MISLPDYLKLLTLFVCVVGGLMGYLVSNVFLFYFNKSLNRYLMSYFSGSMWSLPYISTYGIISYPLMLGGRVNKSFDQGWSEYMGGQNLYSELVKYSRAVRVIHNNNLKVYLLLFVLSSTFLVLFFFVYFKFK